MSAAGKTGEPLGSLDDLVAGLGTPLAMANFARTFLIPRGEDARAHALCERALRCAPDDAELAAICAEVFSHGTPGWYFPMVTDDVRHAAYARAFERALAAGGRVLDLGGGTGLFAMMAARAGAEEVVSCERRPMVARAAREVVEANGLGDRIKVIAKSSTDLDIGPDLADRADVLIWDNLTSDLMGAGALPAIEDAAHRLLKPGGRIIPARCEIVAALAEDRSAGRRMGSVDGFDLTPFNKYAAPWCALQGDEDDVELRSESVVLFSFDFASGGPFPSARTSREVFGRHGSVNGVAQWLELHLDEQERLGTGFGRRVGGLGPIFHRAARSLPDSGQGRLAIGASHDRERVRIWVEAL
jgi:SAM-dependent methyltransferase